MPVWIVDPEKHARKLGYKDVLDRQLKEGLNVLPGYGDITKYISDEWARIAQREKGLMMIEFRRSGSTQEHFEETVADVKRLLKKVDAGGVRVRFDVQITISEPEKVGSLRISVPETEKLVDRTAERVLGSHGLNSSEPDHS